MDTIDDLGFSQFDFLTRDLGFQAVSRLASPFFGDTAVILEKDSLFVRLARDRGDLYVDLSGSGKDGEWEGLDLVRNLILNLDAATNATDEQYVEFLKKHLDSVRDLFNDQNATVTKMRLKELLKEALKKKYPGSVQD